MPKWRGVGNFWIFYDCSPNSTTTSGERAYNLSVLKHVFHVVQQPKLNRKWSHLHFTLSPLHAPPSIQYFESGLNTKGNSGKHRIDKHIFLSWKPVAARVFFRCLSQRFVFSILLNIKTFTSDHFFICWLLVIKLICELIIWALPIYEFYERCIYKKTVNIYIVIAVQHFVKHVAAVSISRTDKSGIGFSLLSYQHFKINILLQSSFPSSCIFTISTLTFSSAVNVFLYFLVYFRISRLTFSSAVTVRCCSLVVTINIHCYSY